MATGQPVTCEIRYTLNLNELSAFETYARTWIALVERYGGTHHGYFLPRETPDSAAVSFPGLGQDGPTDVAVALFTFPNEASYQRYRKLAANDPECHAATKLVQQTACFTSYERLFLRPLIGAEKTASC